MSDTSAEPSDRPPCDTSEMPTTGDTPAPRPAGFDAAAAADEVVAQLRAIADPARGSEMSRYMRGLFPYLGVASPQRREATRHVVRAARTARAREVIDFAERCWTIPERELQYVATDALREARSVLGPDDLGALRGLITTKSWWDTVDAIAPWPVGSLVERHPDLVAAMDDWIVDDDIWVARSALLHQLHCKDRTDADRLFRYVLTVADSTEFFLRKASGWALRQYARADPEAVRAFVADHDAELSTLTKREALKRIGSGPTDERGAS